MSQQIALPTTNSGHLRSNALALWLVAVVGLAAFWIAGWFLTRTYVSTSSVSPDGKLRADIVERSFRFIDRNFRVRIVDDQGNSRFVFRSPDETTSDVSQERLLWSSDSKQVMLVGNFFARKGAEFDDGQFLYLLYNVDTGEVWCNADQTDLPPFDEKDLEGFDLQSLRKSVASKR